MSRVQEAGRFQDLHRQAWRQQQQTTVSLDLGKRTRTAVNTSRRSSASLTQCESARAHVKILGRFWILGSGALALRAR